MSVVKLTIGIPTYNRSATIRDNMASIVDRLPPWVSILICDNASEPPVDLPPDVWASARDRGIKLHVHRNPVNVGATANILRLFEMIDTEWLLLLGDDDPLRPEQLAAIADCIARHAGSPIIKFSSPYFSYAKEKVVQTFDELMEEGGNFNHLLFMSTYLYHIERCRPYVRYGYFMAIAAAPQLAILIMAALDRKPVVLSPLSVTHARDTEPAWSPADLRLNFYTLTDLPMSPDQRGLFRRKIYSGHNIFRELLDIASVHASNPEEGAYVRDKALSVHRVHGHGAKSWAARILLRVGLVAGPRLLGPLKALYARSKGRNYQHVFTSRHDRL